MQFASKSRVETCNWGCLQCLSASAIVSPQPSFLMTASTSVTSSAVKSAGPEIIKFAKAILCESSGMLSCPLFLQPPSFSSVNSSSSQSTHSTMQSRSYLLRVALVMITKVRYSFVSASISSATCCLFVLPGMRRKCFMPESRSALMCFTSLSFTSSESAGFSPFYAPVF